MEEVKEADVVDPVAECSKEVNAILEKYGMAIAVSQPQPVLVPKKELSAGK